MAIISIHCLAKELKFQAVLLALPIYPTKKGRFPGVVKMTNQSLTKQNICTQEVSDQYISLAST